jgi:serine/threonine protein kinase
MRKISGARVEELQRARDQEIYGRFRGVQRRQSSAVDCLSMSPAAGGSGTKHRYVKESKVGEGTYAIVYLGRQLGTNRKVAIKSIRIGSFKDG